MEALSRHHDPPVYLILRIEKMHITGCNDRLAKLIAKVADLPVDILQIFHGLYRCFLIIKQEHVVSNRLDLIVIIEITKSCDFILALSVQYCTVKLARLTGGANDQTFPVFVDQTLRHTWTPVKICQMRLRNQTVQIHSSNLICRQYDTMIRFCFPDCIRRCSTRFV